jgi:tagaturonate reductase
MIETYMILSKQHLNKIKAKGLKLPGKELLSLPEKVLQFGTGVLLRGLPDYFIDKANREGIFNGRIVVVKSTSSGGTADFDSQDNLYTLAVKGIESNACVEENIVCSAISRVLTASTQWQEILKCAHNPELKIIVSNTTEVGIQLVNEKIREGVPVSFPGKLLAFLYERYISFHGSEDSGMVIIPTELIPDNGLKLKEIVISLASFNSMEEAFIKWLSNSNHFCSSLVDRIVPGKPDEETVATFEKEMGYTDQLLIVSEVYRLWAIQGNEHVRGVLSFSKADAGVVIAPDIDMYRELKLRLLNGTHTLSCGIAFLAGLETVKSGMDDPDISSYIQRVMRKEIALAIPYPVDKKDALEFADKVLDRFRNPYIKHLWHSITTQYSAKLKMRVLPVLLQYYKNFNTVPPDIATGFAAWILFMRAVSKDKDRYKGEYQGRTYRINDDQADYIFNLWQKYGEEHIVHAILKDDLIWNTDLTLLAGFEEAVNKDLKSMISKGIMQTLQSAVKV